MDANVISWQLKILADCVVVTREGAIVRSYIFDPAKRAQVEELLSKIDERALRAVQDDLHLSPGLLQFVSSR